MKQIKLSSEQRGPEFLSPHYPTAEYVEGGFGKNEAKRTGIVEISAVEFLAVCKAREDIF